MMTRLVSGVAARPRSVCFSVVHPPDPGHQRKIEDRRRRLRTARLRFVRPDDASAPRPIGAILPIVLAELARRCSDAGDERAAQAIRSLPDTLSPADRRLAEVPA